MMLCAIVMLNFWIGKTKFRLGISSIGICAIVMLHSSIGKTKCRLGIYVFVGAPNGLTQTGLSRMATERNEF